MWMCACALVGVCMCACVSMLVCACVRCECVFDVYVRW